MNKFTDKYNSKKDYTKISDFGGISKEKVCDQDKSRVTVPVDRVYDE
jgi:hypothetical protein